MEQEKSKVHGNAKDGKIFDADSPEVIEYLKKYPDVTLEAAIGSVIEIYNRQLEDADTGTDKLEDQPTNDEPKEDEPVKEPELEESED